VQEGYLHCFGNEAAQVVLSQVFGFECNKIPHHILFYGSAFRQYCVLKLHYVFPFGENHVASLQIIFPFGENHIASLQIIFLFGENHIASLQIIFLFGENHNASLRDTFPFRENRISLQRYEKLNDNYSGLGYYSPSGKIDFFIIYYIGVL
jgi:hypothetical protein